MAETRLSKAATEFNLGMNNIVDFLSEKGYAIDKNPNAKITEEMYGVLVKNFSSSKAEKAEAKSLLVKREFAQAPVPKAPEPPVVKVAEKVVIIEKPVEIIAPKPIVVEEVKIEEIKIEKPIVVEIKQVGPKILGKVDLSKPKKEPVKPVVAEKVELKKVDVEKPKPEVALKTPAVETTEEVVDEKIETQYQKLTGTKVLKTIALPAEKSKGVKGLAKDAREDLKEKRKRKRKDVTAEKVTITDKPKEETKPAGFISRDKNALAKKPVSPTDVNKNLQKTRGNMGGAGKSRGLKQKLRNQRKEDRVVKNIEDRERKERESKILKVTEFVTANDLATMMDLTVTAVIGTCMKIGIMVSINQRLDADTIQLVAGEYGYEIDFVDAETQTEAVDDFVDNQEDIKFRAPIITVMGHVDHGKTSLLDYIRKTNVLGGEAGGITQHIGSYSVKLDDNREITFLDTPGHAAFTAMRARGAKVTDIAIIVIAADDSVMPQTKEAIAHAQAANVPMVFAFNKIDKDGANTEKIREQLSAMNILVEEWGGKYQTQEISAKKGLNINELLDKVLIEAEFMNLTANPTRPAKGTVVEARMEKGRGMVCDMLIQNGTLSVGDYMIAGPNSAKVRAMFDSRGQRIDKAGPSQPIKMLGFSEAPAAGDTFMVMEESIAKELANKRSQLVREQGIRTMRHITLDEIGRRLKVGTFKELKLLIKGDVDGSVEALTDSLLKLTNEEISVTVIYSGVGAITESDVLLASASDAIIIGFQVRPSAAAKNLAENEEIEIKTYSIIYKAIEEVKLAMEGLLSPDVIEKVIGTVEIRETFKISKVGTIAGGYVTDGFVERNSKLRVIRDGVVMFEGELGSLKRFKEDVKDVQRSYECGLQVKNYNDLEVGDYLEIYKIEEVKRKLK